LDDLQALCELLGLKFRGGLSNFHAQVGRDLLQLEREQQVTDSLSANLGGEGIGTILVLGIQELLFGQKLALGERGQACIENDVVLEVEDAFDILERHVEQQHDTARQRLQEPDVGNRSCQLDVTHALATNAAQGNFNAALLADDALELHALVDRKSVV